MPLSRKDKKRIAAYSVGAAAKCVRGALMTSAFIAKVGISGGELLGSLIIGSSMALADELTGVHSRTHVGDTVSHGLCNTLRKAADWTSDTGCRGVSWVEKMAKRKIITGRW